MPYYHHNTEKILYSLPDRPIVSRKIREAKHVGWTILGSLEITYAKNPAGPTAAQFKNPTLKVAVSTYEAEHSHDAALHEYFRHWVPDTAPITEAEYRRLQSEYLQASRI